MHHFRLPSVPLTFPNLLNNYNSGLFKFRIRSLRLETDLTTIHDWMNLPYSWRFWNFAQSHEHIYNHYSSILASTRSHSFIVEVNKKPVALIDLYGIRESDIEPHIENPQPADAGIHFLMAPHRFLMRGWSLMSLQLFVDYFFKSSPGAILYAEPDKKNLPAIRLAKKAGFMICKEIKLAEKEAILLKVTEQSRISLQQTKP